MTKYTDNPYFVLLIYLLITHQISDINIKTTLLSDPDLNLSKLLELEKIVARNIQLNDLERNLPSNNKTTNAGDYYRLKRDNALFLHKIINLGKPDKSSPKLYAPKLVDLCVRTICLYSNTKGEFGNPIIKIDKKKKLIGIQKKQQVSYWLTLNLDSEYDYYLVPKDVSRLINKQLNSKTTFESIQDRYNKLYSFFIEKEAFVYNREYQQIITNFLLYCAIKNSENSAYVISATSMPFLNGITALDIACELKAPRNLIENLLKKTKNINYANNHFNFTALDRACLFGSISLVSTLLKHGAQINRSSLSNFSPLHLSCYYGYDKLSVYLLRHGAKMTRQIDILYTTDYYVYFYYSNATALHFALLSNCKSTVKYIIKHHDDFSQLTAGDVHVLHLACAHMNHRIVRQLCKKIANKSILDSKLQTPFDYVNANSDPKEKKLIYKILKKSGIFNNKKITEKIAHDAAERLSTTPAHGN